MLSDFLKRLKGAVSDEKPLPADQARVAVAALLVGAARIDGHYAAAETALIERLLAARYGLDPEAAARLRTEGEAAEDAANDVFRFTQLVKASVPIEERGAIVEALWRVVLCDAARDPEEDALMRKLVDLLGLSSMDSAQARQRALAGG